jgi:hypothetical protein
MAVAFPSLGERNNSTTFALCTATNGGCVIVYYDLCGQQKWPIRARARGRNIGRVKDHSLFSVVYLRRTVAGLATTSVAYMSWTIPAVPYWYTNQNAWIKRSSHGRNSVST